ncbi:hypothetical protein NMG60_11000139 [Bertholletia excelsa]
MGDQSRNVDVEKVITFSNDLIQVLKDGKDVNSLALLLEQSTDLQLPCDADYNDVQSLLLDYEKNIDLNKKKADEAKSEVAADAEMNLLQQELEEELHREHLLRKELSVITSEISDLEHQMVAIEERRKILKKVEQDELRTQMKLSMYASVTNVIPNLDDPNIVSGHIVERDKKVVEKFDFDPSKATVFDTCNSIWKMIEMQ